MTSWLGLVKPPVLGLRWKVEVIPPSGLWLGVKRFPQGAWGGGCLGLDPHPVAESSVWQPR